MRTAPPATLTLLTLPLLAMACSSGSGTGGGGSGVATIAMTELPDKAMDAVCSFAARCGNESPLPFWFSTKQACIDALKASGLMEMEEIAKVDKGEMTYDAEMAAKCVKAFETVSCAGFDPDTNPECEAVFTGTAKNGEACKDEDSCKDGWCEGLDEPSFGCPGVCAAKKKAGDACKKKAECEGKLACVGGKCGTATPKKDGDPCEDGVCEADQECVPVSGKDVCKTLPPIGEACLEDSVCAKGARCVEGKCAAPGKEGESCNPKNVTNRSECAEGLTCALIMETGKPPTGKCMTAKKAGEACTAIFECLGFDQYCKSGKCAPVPGLGEPCADKKESPAFQCSLGLKCSADGKCVKSAKAAEGEDCSSVACADGLVCNSDKCEKAPEPVCK